MKFKFWILFVDSALYNYCLNLRINGNWLQKGIEVFFVLTLKSQFHEHFRSGFCAENFWSFFGINSFWCKCADVHQLAQCRLFDRVPNACFLALCIIQFFKIDPKVEFYQPLAKSSIISVPSIWCKIYQFNFLCKHFLCKLPAKCICNSYFAKKALKIS